VTDIEEPEHLRNLHERFRRWLGDSYDLGAIDATCATAAVEQLEGDPCWLILISGSGNAKTETVMALTGAGALTSSKVTGEAALLSGTSKKERSAKATGGLLRRIGSRGILVLKDFTSIISMNTERRNEVLGALREVYDGHWDREVGADGGNVLTWDGRIVVVAACTTAYDSAHSVIATMGDRFVLYRMNSSETVVRLAAGRQSLMNVGDEAVMRAELAAAVGDVLKHVRPELAVLSADVQDNLLRVANLVTLGRTAVQRDYQGNVIGAEAPEMPTRFAKMLAQIVRGGLSLGMTEEYAVSIAVHAGGDSMPPLRLDALWDVYQHPGSTYMQVAKRLQKPRSTVDRELQALHLIGLLHQQDAPNGESGWRYVISGEVEVSVLERIAPRNAQTNVLTTQAQGTPSEPKNPRLGISGQGLTAVPNAGRPIDYYGCAICGDRMDPTLDGATTHPGCEVRAA
jgi:hypothetical protein